MLSLCRSAIWPYRFHLWYFNGWRYSSGIPTNTNIILFVGNRLRRIKLILFVGNRPKNKIFLIGARTRIARTSRSTDQRLSPFGHKTTHNLTVWLITTPGHTRPHWTIPGHTGPYRITPGHTRPHWTTPGDTGPFYMHIQNSVIFLITQFYHATYSIARANKDNKLFNIV